MREGLIPVMLGAAVTAAGSTVRARDMRKRGFEQEEIVPMLAAGVIGFGLAHVVLGSIDLFEHRR